MSSEHFTVDGTLIEAWASQKSFVRKDEKRRDDDDPGNPTVNFRGEKRSNQTHASRTDPDARLAGMRGQGARLAYQGHVVTENRNGLVVAAKLTQASGYAEREAALEMVLGSGGALAGSPWLETRATTPRALCRRFGPGALPRTWHRTRRTAEARSIEGPQDTRATR